MSDIDEIKSRLNIVDIIGARIPLKKAGRNFKALCPFHGEKTPSFIVSPDRQTFHCFGCGKGGSVIDWIMEYEHVDFLEALETLAEKAGIKLERRHDDTPQNKLKAKIYEVNHLASEYYQYILARHALGEKARFYLKNRGVSDKAAATFGLGYSPNSWDGLRKFLHKKNYDDGILEAAGLLVKSKNGGYDRFRGRVMFTLRDHRGNVVGFSGRVLDQTTKDAKYINTSETPVYIKGNVLYGLDVTKSAIAIEGAILMEGEFDVISAFQEGISNVVAIKGSALTEGHVNLLRRYTDRLIFALDSDVAGDVAARRGIELAEKAGFDMKVMSLPSGQDPDEAVRENPHLVKKAIADAVPIYDYFINSASERYDLESAYGKKKISTELVPILTKIENPVVQSHYIKKVAQILDVNDQVISESMRKHNQSLRVPSLSVSPEKPKDDIGPRQKFEIYVLAIVLQTSTMEYFDELKEYFQANDFSHPGISRILELLDSYLLQNQAFLIADFADSLPKELLPVLDQAFLWDLSDIIDNEELVAREWNKILREFRRQAIKYKLKLLTKSLSSGESKSPATDTHVIDGEVTKLTEELRLLEKSAST